MFIESKEILSKVSTKILCEVYENLSLKSKNDTHPNGATQFDIVVFRWLLDELCKRDEEALIKWSNASNPELEDKPSHFFLKGA